MSRVVKLGNLDQKKLMDAIANAPVVELGKFEWTITDVVDERNGNLPFLYGNLAKYFKEGSVTVVDEPAKQQLKANAPNLLEASSPFVYLPQTSGLAYLHVWNGIQSNVFPRRFESIIEAAFDRFFVDCTVEPITDYRAFLDRLRGLSRISELSAKVHPSNPLFGRLWGSLDDYLRERRASEVNVREKSESEKGIATKLLTLITKLLENPKFEPDTPPSITDAAMLMAADGYGEGKAVGVEKGSAVVVKTSESHKSFVFEPNPSPEALALVATKHFAAVTTERDMSH